MRPRLRRRCWVSVPFAKGTGKSTEGVLTSTGEGNLVSVPFAKGTGKSTKVGGADVCLRCCCFQSPSRRGQANLLGRVATAKRSFGVFSPLREGDRQIYLGVVQFGALGLLVSVPFAKGTGKSTVPLSLFRNVL